MTRTLMRQDIEEIPHVAESLLVHGSAAIGRVADRLNEIRPSYLTTVARGSSDHVCTYLKYACELTLGLPVASMGPSVASIYGADLSLGGGACIAISQSGQSPDVLTMIKAAKRSGAVTMALSNDVASPLAQASDAVLDVRAGHERAVAATKTFINSAITGLLLLARMKGDRELRDALHALPAALARAIKIDWSELRSELQSSRSAFTLGRGPSWAMANEASLKLKEVCQIHAESYSSAEVLHGPVSIIEEGFPILCLAAGDAAEASLAHAVDTIAVKGARVFATTEMPSNAHRLEHLRSPHPLTDPLLLIATVYAFIETLSRALGLDTDAPRHLSKVTETT